MTEKLKCPNCKKELSPEEILKNSTIAWPELNWIYFDCPSCKNKKHILIKNGSMATVQYLGAPGPNWEIIEEIEINNFHTRMDPKYAHAWLNGRHYEFKVQE